jgi:hypothetical protein
MARCAALYYREYSDVGGNMQKKGGNSVFEGGLSEPVALQVCPEWCVEILEAGR